ncbi:hypothetical protein ACQY0O_006733 [Thecaphora frezii]
MIQPSSAAAAPADPGGPSAALAAALRRAAILAGHHDEQFGIQRATPSASRLNLSKLKPSTDAVNLADVLAARLCHSGHQGLLPASSDDEGQIQRATGDAALDLLVEVHRGLLQKKLDPSTKVATAVNTHQHGGQGATATTAAGEEDVGLGVKDRKLAGTLLSLAARWALLPRIEAYDAEVADAFPALAPRTRTGGNASMAGQTGRFEEIVEDDEAKRRAKLQRFAASREQLARVSDQWTSMLVSSAALSGSQPGRRQREGAFHASTDISNLLLQTNTVDLIAALLRLAMGPTSPMNRSKADGVQQDAVVRLSSLLKFLSTASAISMLSMILSHQSSKASAGLPTFVRSSASRLLSAQLLRPDGVRAVLIATLGGVDIDEDAGDSATTEGATKSTLQKYEHLARLLGTAPQGLDASTYLAMTLPRLFDIIDPDPKTTVTAPSPSHMRAAAFALTRISEKHPGHFRTAAEVRIYKHFNPVPKGSGDAAAGDDQLLVSATDVARAVTLLSSLLLFAEPSPVFFDRLLASILPQLLSLCCFVQTTTKRSAKAKVRQIGDVDQQAVLRKQVEGLLRAWFRLADAEGAARTLARAINRPEQGIGGDFDLGAVSADDGEERSVYWAEDVEGVSIRFGRPATQSHQGAPDLLGTLSLSDLAKAISSTFGGADEASGSSANGLVALPAGLASSLRLDPDPKTVVDLLSRAKRMDVAKHLLPRILDSYMGQKLRQRAGIGAGSGGGGTTAAFETRSILHLQLILQLFEAFGSELLGGDVATTLTFINFSLSSPEQRRVEKSSRVKNAEQGQTQEDEATPFIRQQKPSARSAASLFDINGGDRDREEVDREHKAGDEDEDEDGDGEDTENDEELVTTSLTLLLSLLEGNPNLSTETTPMLLVIESKIERHLDSAVEEIRALSKEARMVLTARRNAVRGPRPMATSPSEGGASTTPLSARAQGYAQTQETYQEALQLLQDPILPVRAHGLVLLRQLVSSDVKDKGQREHLDPALLPAILDIFIQAVQDEESYLYLNAVQGLSAMGASGGRETISSLVAVYLGRDVLASVKVSQREVDKRLRVGEALLQVVQKCGEALSPNVDVLVPPLLAKLRDAATPTTLRSSIISILGTTVEAVPLVLAARGLAREMVTTCLDLISVETVARPNLVRQKVTMKVSGKVQDVSEDEDDQEADEAARPKQKGGLDSATTTDSKVASLRRAALLLIVTMLRATKHQLLDASQPSSDEGETQLDSLRLPTGGALPSLSGRSGQASRTVEVRHLLFPYDLIASVKRVCAFVAERDTDAVVRIQAKDCVDEARQAENETLALALAR